MPRSPRRGSLEPILTGPLEAANLKKLVQRTKSIETDTPGAVAAANVDICGQQVSSALSHELFHEMRSDHARRTSLSSCSRLRFLRQCPV
jgi:hypothetical protein